MKTTIQLRKNLIIEQIYIKKYVFDSSDIHIIMHRV
jgi:hypothetical protein